jgi:deoxycytidine triphosphate deaminase
MQQLADELRRGLLFRADALADKIGEYRGRLGETHLPIAGVLDLCAQFPTSMKHVIEEEWQHNTDPDSRVQILRALLVHQTMVTTFVDEWLSHDTQSEIPLYLLAAVQRSCEAMGLGPREPILAAGPANNFVTMVGDLRVALFGKLGPYCPPLPPDLTTTEYVLLRAPLMEGRNVLWAPILLGHELGHLAVNSNSAVSALNLQQLFDYSKAKQVAVPGSPTHGTDQAAMILYDIAESWAVELLCDAYAVRAYGVGGIAAMAEYLEVIGATDNLNTSHPPGRLRIELMLAWLPAPVDALSQILLPWYEFLSTSAVAYPDWAVYLLELFRTNASAILAEANRWSGESYDTNERSTAICAIASDLAEGMPGDLVYALDGNDVEVAEADVITAAWLARVQEADAPTASLAQKGLESNEFVRRWRAAGGMWERTGESTSDIPPSTAGAVLSERQILHRLSAAGTQRLIVRPCFPGAAGGAGMDVRLGNQFIVFVRSRTASFDPLRADHEPRSMQRFAQLPWGERFVLHPNELVLAATLEYLVIPADLTAQVITRSSYGRLGLLSATAVQVHPHFHGCLTLELVNLSTVPLELTPGERVAQLVFTNTTETEATRAKYHFPVGPQFSRVRVDSEAEILRNL